MRSDIADERVKGFVYAEEPDRLRWISPDHAVFEGRHSEHNLTLVDGGWTCDCDMYRRLAGLPIGGWCRHTIAAERGLPSWLLDALPASASDPARRRWATSAATST